MKPNIFLLQKAGKANNKYQTYIAICKDNPNYKMKWLSASNYYICALYHGSVIIDFFETK